MAISNLQFISPTNSYMPEETGQVIAFIRDKNKFPLMSYVQFIPVGRKTFIYLVLERDEAVRVVSLNELTWGPGMTRKNKGRDRGTRFRQQTGFTTRRNRTAFIERQSDELNDRWDVTVTETEACASQLMTGLTLDVWNNLSNSANWLGNTADANSLNNGRGVWNEASDDPNNPKYNAIQLSIMNAVRYIKMLTNNRVDFKDLQLVINPDTAIGMSLAPEIRHILNNTPALAQATQNAARNGTWGLPGEIAGVPIVVEDSPIVTQPVTNASGDSEAIPDQGRTWIAPSGTAYLLSRPGALEGAPGSASFSTVQIFHMGGMVEVESFPDEEDRITRAQVSHEVCVTMPAPYAGYQITNILG